MTRGTTPEDMTFSDAIALRTQAHNFLRLALDSDDNSVREKYFNATREVLAEMERVIESSEKPGQIKVENGSDRGVESEEEEHNSDEEEEEEERRKSESEEDQQWGEGNDQSSEEEEWDSSNGENDSRSSAVEDSLLAYSFANGAGKSEPDLTAVDNITHGTFVNLSSQRTTQESNLDVRVYARMMELFEIESRHRMSICNIEWALHKARDDFARSDTPKQVSNPVLIARMKETDTANTAGSYSFAFV